jgi:hypothetical protein
MKMMKLVSDNKRLRLVCETTRTAVDRLLLATWLIFASHRRRMAIIFAVMFLITTIAPPVALCQLEKKIPPPAMPPHGVRKGPRTVKLITPKLFLSSNPSDEEISHAHLFEEPLAAMSGKTSAEENQALAKALLSYKGKRCVSVAASAA